MHNWRLLLLAFLAVLEPIASFTERNLVDGREQCCERNFRDEGRSYGTYRFSKSSPDVRRVNRGTGGDRRYDVRTDLVLNRNLFERRVQDYRSERDRERTSPLSNIRSKKSFRFIGPAEDSERRELNRFASGVTNRANQYQDFRRVTAREKDFLNSIRQDDRIRNYVSTFRLSRDKYERNEIERSRAAMFTRRDSPSHREVQENRQIRVTLLRARDNLVAPGKRMTQRDVFSSRLMEREHSNSNFMLERVFENKQRSIQRREVSRSSEPNMFHRQREQYSERSEQLDQRARSNESQNIRNTRISNDRVDMRNQDRRLSEFRGDQRREVLTRRSFDGSMNGRFDSSSNWRQSLYEQSLREAKVRREMSTSFDNTREHRNREERSVIRRGSTRVSDRRFSSESRIVRDRQYRSENRESQWMTRRIVDERNLRSARRLTENRTFDLRNRQSTNRAIERDSGNRVNSRLRTERRDYNHERRNRDIPMIEVTRRDTARQQTRERTASPENDLRRDTRLERSIRRDFRKNERNVQDSHRNIRARELRQKTIRREYYQVNRRNLRQTAAPEIKLEYANNNLERENSLFRDIQMARTFTLIREKTLPEDQSPMNWQYLLYTLQGIYICGIIAQLFSAKEPGKKPSSLAWWTGSAKKLIKMD